MSLRDDIRKIAETEDLKEKINKINQGLPVVSKSAIEAARGIAYQKGDGTSKSTSTTGGSNTNAPGVVDSSGTSNTVELGSTAGTPTNNAANNTTETFNQALTVGGNAGVNGALNGTNVLGLGSNNSVISPNSSNTDMGASIGGGGGSPASPLQGGDGVVPPGQGGANSTDTATRDTVDAATTALTDATDDAGNPLPAGVIQDQQNRVAIENGMNYPGLYRVGNLFSDNPFAWNMYVSDAVGGSNAAVAGSPVIDGIVGQIGDKWAAIMFKELSDVDDVPPGWTDRDTPPIDTTWELGKFWRINITGGLGDNNVYAGNTFSDVLSVGNSDLLGNLQFRTFPDGYNPVGQPGVDNISNANEPSNADLGKDLWVMDTVIGSVHQQVAYYPDNPLSTYVYGQFDCPSAGALGSDNVCGITVPESAYTETTYPVSNGIVLEFNGGGVKYPVRNENIPQQLKQGNTKIFMTDELFPGKEYEVGLTNNGGWYITDNDTATILMRPDRSVKDVVPAEMTKYFRSSNYLWPF